MRALRIISGFVGGAILGLFLLFGFAYAQLKGPGAIVDEVKDAAFRFRVEHLAAREERRALESLLRVTAAITVHESLHGRAPVELRDLLATGIVDAEIASGRSPGYTIHYRLRPYDNDYPRWAVALNPIGKSGGVSFERISTVPDVLFAGERIDYLPRSGRPFPTTFLYGSLTLRSHETEAGVFLLALALLAFAASGRTQEEAHRRGGDVASAHDPPGRHRSRRHQVRVCDRDGRRRAP